MQKLVYKCIVAATAISCLLTGCGRNDAAEKITDEPATFTSESGDLSDLFEDDSSAMEVGSFSYGWPDERDVFPYSGKALDIPFKLMGTKEGAPQEVGLLLFVDGIAQPYSVAFDDGTELADAYMQTFQLEQDVENIFHLIFQPVTGKAGDTLSVQAVTILTPGYLPEGEENPNYGYYHSANITIPLQIAFEKDAPAEGQKKASENYEIVDIPKSITDNDKFFGIESSRDANTNLSVVSAEDENSPVLCSKDGTVTFKVRLYGGPEANQNITVYVNHEPVQVDGADYFAVRTQKDKMVEATVTLSASAFGENNTIYAIAASTGRDSNLTETVKSSSILFVNRANAQAADVSTSNYLEPQYDTQSNTLTLTDMAAGTTQATYHFDEKQSLLSAEKIKNGVVVLAASQASDAETSDGISFSTNTGNADSVIVYRFDEQLHLQDSFRPDDADLSYTLQNYPYAVSPDGEELTWVQEDGIYRYTLETENVTQVPLKLPETIYFVQVRYSGSGKSLFYHGGSDREGITFYGALDVETGEGTLFEAKDFEAISIEVTGEYAVVNAAVPPKVTSGSGRVLLIDSEKKSGNEITLKNICENDLAVLTADGKTLVTCAATDSKGGVLRCYDTASRNLKSEQSYSLEQENKPYLLMVQGKVACAVLFTEQGFVRSSPINLQ